MNNGESDHLRITAFVIILRSAAKSAARDLNFHTWIRGISLNKYLRAIGFTDLPKRSQMMNIIRDGVQRPVSRAYTTNDNDEDSLLAEFEIETGNQFGIAVSGQFNESDEFYPDYYYPYLDTGVISTAEELSVESRIDQYTYAGICDDVRVGVTLIFRLRNTIEYLKNTHKSFMPLDHATVSLTALSLEGTVMLPIYKTPDELRQKKDTEIKRRRLINAARSGDENAMKDLTISDMDLYSNLITHIQTEDLYTLVESYFMPYGAECDLYSVMGDITSVAQSRNTITGEEVDILSIDCNGLPFDVAINRKDLYGDPQPGRRFKGVIWLQGKINFPLGSAVPETEQHAEM